jgi:hypothetical protein
MNRNYLKLIMNEVRNFKELQKQWRYMDLDDLVAHYIEEGVISSRPELIGVSAALEKKFGIKLNKNIFNDWWIARKY